jgi:hypothetical protein
MDCFGVCFGYAYYDNCNYCVGGNTGVAAQSGIQAAKPVLPPTQ